jgi:hypothetical protein
MIVCGIIKKLVIKWITNPSFVVMTWIVVLEVKERSMLWISPLFL